jgi:hypothetical protein
VKKKMSIRNEYCPELLAPDAARLREMAGLVDPDGMPSERAAGHLNLFKHTVAMFVRMLRASERQAPSEVHLLNHDLETDPRDGEWLSYRFQVPLNFPMRGLSEHMTRQLLTSPLRDAGFFMSEDEPRKGGLRLMEVGLVLRVSEPVTLEVTVTRVRDKRLEARGGWLPRKMTHVLPDGSVFYINKPHMDFRSLSIFPRQARVCPQRGLLCKGSRVWRTTPDDTRVWAVLEAVQSASAKWPSVKALIDRLGIPAWEEEEAPLHSQEDDIYLDAKGALDFIAKAARQFHPPGQTGAWKYDDSLKRDFYWVDRARNLPILAYETKFEGARIVLKSFGSATPVLSFLPEGDILDPENLELQYARFRDLMSKAWETTT